MKRVEVHQKSAPLKVGNLIRLPSANLIRVTRIEISNEGDEIVGAVYEKAPNYMKTAVFSPRFLEFYGVTL